MEGRQGELDLGLEVAAAAGRLEIVSSRMGSWEALCSAYDVLGFVEATGGDEVFHPCLSDRAGGHR